MSGKYTCPDCGRPFASGGALGGHRKHCKFSAGREREAESLSNGGQGDAERAAKDAAKLEERAAAAAAKAAAAAAAPKAAPVADPAPAAPVAEVTKGGAVPLGEYLRTHHGEEIKRGALGMREGAEKAAAALKDGGNGAEVVGKLVTTGVGVADLIDLLCETALPPKLSDKEYKGLQLAWGGWELPEWLGPYLITGLVVGPRMLKHPDLGPLIRTRLMSPAKAGAQRARAAVTEPVPVPESVDTTLEDPDADAVVDAFLRVGR